MLSSFIKYFILVRSVCATCESSADNDKACKIPFAFEEVVMIQRVAAKVISTPDIRDNVSELAGKDLKAVGDGRQHLPANQSSIAVSKLEVVTGFDIDRDGVPEFRRTRGRVPRAFVLALDHEKGKRVQDLLPAEMSSETVIGFNGSAAPELHAAVELLSDAKVNRAVSLEMIGAGMLCMHTTEHGTYIDEPANLIKMQKYKEFWQQLHSDMASLAFLHPCIALSISADAGHMKIWQKIAQLEEGSWYMILEDDVEFCPGWFDRMAEDLERAPDDADILKLFWFAGSPATSKDVFAKVNPIPLGNGISNCSNPACEIKELLSLTSSIATYMRPRDGDGVRASSAAYLIRPSSARKMLARFSDADMADMDLMMPHLGNVYVWNNVLATPRDSTSKFLVLHHYAPSCH